MKLFLCMQTNIKLLYRLIVLILVGTARDAQITQNNKFEKYLYLKKELGTKLNFYANEHQSFL